MKIQYLKGWLTCILHEYKYKDISDIDVSLTKEEGIFHRAIDLIWHSLLCICGDMVCAAVGCGPVVYVETTASASDGDKIAQWVLTASVAM